MAQVSRIIGALSLLLLVPVVLASAPVQEERHELMESAKDAAKPIGNMLKGEQDFDAAIVMESFGTWEHVAATAGSLFQVGSETGYDTRAKETVWTDREGFDSEMEQFAQNVARAIEAAPQDLESLNAAAGPVLKSCKGCHESFRAERED